jgi:hypothetical protein
LPFSREYAAGGADGGFLKAKGGLSLNFCKQWPIKMHSYAVGGRASMTREERSIIKASPQALIDYLRWVVQLPEEEFGKVVEEIINGN